MLAPDASEHSAFDAAHRTCVSDADAWRSGKRFGKAYRSARVDDHVCEDNLL